MIIALTSISTFLVVVFLSYVILIVSSFVWLRREKAGDPERFHWHLFIPCRDEGAVIGTTIARARDTFPNAHIWVIDDDSDDDTLAIAQKWAIEHPQVHVVARRRPEARLGKGAALNAAYRLLNAWLPSSIDRHQVIVCVVDADGEMAPNAFAAVSASNGFGDDRVGAVQISVWMKNRQHARPLPHTGRVRNAFARYLIRMQDLEFRSVIVGMQAFRGRVGTVSLGGNGQFTRLSTLDVINRRYGAPWHGSLLEDYELGVHVILAGYEIRHIDETHVSQEALPSLRRLLTQRTRWTQGNIQCLKYIPQIYRSPHFQPTGVLESCYYLLLPFMQVLGMLAWATIFVLATVPVFQNITLSTFSGVKMMEFCILICIVGICPFAVWGLLYKIRCDKHISWPAAALYGIGHWLYIGQIYITLCRAFWRIGTRRNGWLKTRRNEENLTLGPTAKDH